MATTTASKNVETKDAETVAVEAAEAPAPKKRASRTTQFAFDEAPTPGALADALNGLPLEWLQHGRVKSYRRSGDEFVLTVEA